MLDGIRVLDLSRYVAGPMAAALLGDLGADVVRIEPPGGAEDRAPLPFADGAPGGAGFVQTGRNKRSLTLDLTRVEGRTALQRLVARADVVIANLPPGAGRELGMDYPTLSAVKTDLVYLHLTAFGNEGPYATRVGFDAIAQVMSGLPHLSGDPGRPMKSAAAWVDMATGFLGAFGVLAALRRRDATGAGGLVEANLWQTALTVGNYFLIEEMFTGIGRSGTGNRAPSGAPADLIATRDGSVYVAVLGNAMFRRFARMIGQPALADDPGLQSDEARAARGEELSAIAAAWAAPLASAEALAMLSAARIPVGPLLPAREILADAHVRAQYLDEVPVTGLDRSLPYIGHPLRYDAVRPPIRRGPPQASEHSDAVLVEAGFTAREITDLRAAGVV